MTLLTSLLALLRGIPGLARLLQSLGLVAGTAVVLTERHRRQDAERANEANRKMLEVTPAKDSDVDERLKDGSF